MVLKVRYLTHCSQKVVKIAKIQYLVTLVIHNNNW